MAGVGNTQIIGGQSYQQYTPEWYAAQDANTIHRAGVAGTAGGTGEANYLSALSPSLQGLYQSMSSGGGGYGGSSSSTPTINYGGGSGQATSTPSAVSYGGMPSTVNYGSTPTAVNYGNNPNDVSSAGLTSSGVETGKTATIGPLDLAQSDAAAFATAKDQAAKTAGASMTGLQQALAARGLGGAGYEAGQIGGTLSREANTIGEAGRAKAVEDANLTAQGNVANLSAGVAQRGQDISSKQSDAARRLAAEEAAYSGGIAQRGQDIGAREAAFSGGIAQRGQDIGARDAAFSGGIAQRGQDIGANDAAYSGSIAQRGQDIGANDAAARLAAERAGTAFSGGITQRGQDIQQQESAAALAQEQARLKSQQTLSILQSVMGGGRGAAYAY